MDIQIVSVVTRTEKGLTPSGDEFDYPAVLDVRYTSPLEGDDTPHVHTISLTAVADVQNTFGYATAMEATEHIILNACADHQLWAQESPQGRPFAVKQFQTTRDLVGMWSDMQKFLVQEAESADLGEEGKMIAGIAAMAMPGKVGAGARNAAPASKAASVQQSVRASMRTYLEANTLAETDGRTQLQSTLDSHGRTISQLQQENITLRYGQQIAGIVKTRLHRAAHPAEPPRAQPEPYTPPSPLPLTEEGPEDDGSTGTDG